MDLILDTNALYYFKDPSKYDWIDWVNFKKKSEEAQHIYVSSITIYEAINFFKNRANHIRRLAKFMKCNHIEILQHDLISIESVTLDELCKIKQKDLTILYKKIIKNKIKLEGKYTAVILNLLIFSFIFFYFIDKNNNESTDSFGKFFYEIGRIIIKVNEQILLELYAMAYNSKDSNTLIKNMFYDLLEYNLQEYVPLLEPFCQTTTKEELELITNSFNYNEFKCQATKLKRKINKKQTSVKYVQGFLRIYERTMQNDALKDYMEKYILNNTEKIHSESMRMYINDSIENMIKNGCAFCKNDIPDRLIIDQITSGRLLITFDNGMKNFLLKHSNINSNYKESILLSNKLKI